MTEIQEAQFTEAQLREDPILQFFAFKHLPPHLAEVSRSFMHLAIILVSTVPQNSERQVALRKLLESKDAAVRARIMTQPPTSAVLAFLE